MLDGHNRPLYWSVGFSFTKPTALVSETPSNDRFNLILYVSKDLVMTHHTWSASQHLVNVKANQIHSKSIRINPTPFSVGLSQNRLILDFN